MLTDEQKVKLEMTMYLQEMAIDGEEDPLTSNERKKVSVHGKIRTEISVHMCYQYSIRAGLQHSRECSYSNPQLIKTRQSGRGITMVSLDNDDIVHWQNPSL